MIRLLFCTHSGASVRNEKEQVVSAMGSTGVLVAGTGMQRVH